MSNVVKFPYSVSRKAYARKPRTSINGTPEERAALQEMVAGSSLMSRVELEQEPERPARDEGETVTCQNGRLRDARREVWREADRQKSYAVGLEISCPGGAYDWAP
jgi:hypothetical protein